MVHVNLLILNDSVKDILLHQLIVFLFSVPPTTSVLLDEKGSEVELNVGPYNVGGTLILTCDILGGKNGVSHNLGCKERLLNLLLFEWNQLLFCLCNKIIFCVHNL